jgi:hypothetical protein
VVCPIPAIYPTASGPAAAAPEAAALRRGLLAALAERRTAAHLHTRAGASAALPPLNPTGLADARQTGTAA